MISFLFAFAAFTATNAALSGSLSGSERERPRSHSFPDKFVFSDVLFSSGLRMSTRALLIDKKQVGGKGTHGGTIRACAALMILRQGIPFLASRRANRIKRNNKQFAPVT